MRRGFVLAKLGSRTTPILGGFCSLKLKTCGAAQLVQRTRLTETDRTFANRFLSQRFSFYALSCKVSGVEVEHGPSRFADTDVHHFVGRASLSSFNHCLGTTAYCFRAFLRPSKSSEFTCRCKKQHRPIATKTSVLNYCNANCHRVTRNDPAKFSALCNPL